jgi:molybdopterin converting factor small subunit
MDMEDMEIHLRLFGLGEQAAGRTETTMHLSRGDTVGSLVEALRTKGGYLSAYLPFDPSTLRPFDEAQGRLGSGQAGLRTGPSAEFTVSEAELLRAGFAQDKVVDRLLILVNGRSVHLLQGLDTPLTDGDQVTIMPKAFGG